MSGGDFGDWNPEPARQFTSKREFNAKVKEKKVRTLVLTLLAIGVGSAIILHYLGAY
jgi:hypothetical protein